MLYRLAAPAILLNVPSSFKLIPWFGNCGYANSNGLDTSRFVFALIVPSSFIFIPCPAINVFCLSCNFVSNSCFVYILSVDTPINLSPRAKPVICFPFNYILDLIKICLEEKSHSLRNGI